MMNDAAYLGRIADATEAYHRALYDGYAAIRDTLITGPMPLADCLAALSTAYAQFTEPAAGVAERERYDAAHGGAGCASVAPRRRQKAAPGLVP